MTWLSTDKAAAHLDLSPGAFDELVRRKGIPHQWVGNSRRFSRDVLDKLVTAGLLGRARRRPRSAVSA
jgi:excisionase family DNA binding protein